jgi:hypothetical protein
MIFNTNIQIFASIMHRWKSLICLDKNTLAMMVALPEQKPDYQLWRMTGVQILALAVQFNIPVSATPE